MRDVFGKLLIVFGVCCLTFFGFLIWQRHYIRQISAVSQRIPVNIPWHEHPVEVTIADLHIDLPVYSARITNGTWETTPEGVSYLSSSPLPGNLGNSILYAHNWSALFGNLRYAKPGQRVTIKFSDGAIRNFMIYYTAIVPASQLHILDGSSDRRITFYTCTGFLDSQRFVAVALLDR